MTVSLFVDIDNVTAEVDLSKVSALDALVYRQATDCDLDVLLSSLVRDASAEDFGSSSWRLADRGILKWLLIRQHISPDEPLAPVLASVTMFPADPDEAA